MVKKLLYIIGICSLLFSCGSYDKLLKSGDNKQKLEAAINYYQQGKWLKAIGLLDAVAPYYKGTSRSGEVLFLTAKSYFGNKDYYLAANYFQTYTRTFPRGENAEESWFMIGFCHYKESPDARLDQTATFSALEALTEYLQIYPTGKWSTDAYKYIDELKNKLAFKELLSVKLYYDLGNYLGNNYLSAIITAQNTLKDFPETAYREELSFLILKSKFKQAEHSVEQRKAERYRETIDEYHNFISEFPNTQNRREAEQILRHSQRFLQ